MQKVTSFLHNLRVSIGAHPLLERALHTAWQGALGFVLAHYTVPHNAEEVQVLATGAYGAALSALKTFVLSYLAGRS